MFAGAVALGFRKYGASVTEPEPISDGVYKFTILYNGKNSNVYVVLDSTPKLLNGIVVSLTDRGKYSGRLFPLDKLNILLRRVGITLDDISEVLSVGGYFVSPQKTPPSYLTDAMRYASDYHIVFTLPMAFPFLRLNVEYKTVVRKLLKKKVVKRRGVVIVNPFSFSYCVWENGLICDNVSRTITPEIYRIAPILKKMENSKVTPEIVSSKLKIKIDQAEKILIEAEKAGFAIPLARNVYRITQVTPRPTKLPRLKLENSIPYSWSNFPYTCSENKVRYSDVERFLSIVIDGRVLDAYYLFIPYIIVGGIRQGRKKIVAYNVITGKNDEVLSEHLTPQFNCLYLLSR